MNTTNEAQRPNVQHPAYARILVCVDADTHAAQVLAAALSIAQAGLTELCVLHVRLPVRRYQSVAERPVPLDELEQPLDEAAHAWLAKLCRQATEESGYAPCVPECILHDAPWQGILERAESHLSDLIVMGSHGRTALKSALLGSVTQQVLAHCKLPVLIVKRST